LKPAPFAYAKARSVAHAIELLVDDDARLLAGGQSLIATLNMRLSHPALLVDINGVGGLDTIASNNGHIEIGALVRHAQAERSPELARRAPLIALAMPHIGHPAIRNRGTIGGSVANSDPAADYPAAVLALGATIRTNKREIKADDFFKGMFETALQDGEIITAIHFPKPDKAGYSKFPNPASRYAIVGVFVAKAGSGVRVAVTGAGPCAFRS
jgi:carbon-monoxide dehydrogenase medium subunit